MSIRKIARLSAADRGLIIRAARLVVLTRFSLWVLPLATVRRFAEKRTKSQVQVCPPERVAWAVRGVSRFVPKATCLVQAIATQTLLGKMGFESQLKVGVALDDKGQFLAHAWVEHDGHIVIGGSDSERYASLLSLETQNL